MRTFQEKKRGSGDLDFGFVWGMVKGAYWVAGLVPHPSQGGDIRFEKSLSPTPKKITAFP